MVNQFVLFDSTPLRKSYVHHIVHSKIASILQKPSGDGVETVCITLDAAHPDTLVSAVITGAVGCVVDVIDTSHR